MESAVIKLSVPNNLRRTEVIGFSVGEIVKITEEGYAVVDYPGNPMGPVEARSVISSSPQQNSEREQLFPVLLAFENGDPVLPVIVGIIRDSLYPPISSHEVTLSIDDDKPQDAVVDGRKVVLGAKEEIVLHCGKSSVTLKKDGKIVVKGNQIISRASGTNKIKGAAVRIN